MRMIMCLMLLVTSMMYSAERGEEFSVHLTRIKVPKNTLKRRAMGESGTHNPVHFSYIGTQHFKATHGFLYAGQTKGNFTAPIPECSKEMALFLSIAKRRFNVFRNGALAKELTIKEFPREENGKRIDHVVPIDNLPKDPKGIIPVTLSIMHDAGFSCNCEEPSLGATQENLVVVYESHPNVTSSSFSGSQPEYQTYYRQHTDQQ